MILKLIPKKLQGQPAFPCIDDTMVTKFGKKFEDTSKLFDHAAQIPYRKRTGIPLCPQQTNTGTGIL